jgi:hypothetical protein
MTQFTNNHHKSLRQRLADLHAERVATWEPAALQVNIDQRRTLVENARRANFVKPGDPRISACPRWMAQRCGCTTLPPSGRWC